ncbi:MAG TPA: putative toxin-antitoxin system toxin component, PIN family [Thermomicrobiales bacterium]|jgi:putative PIN family toxin of toxin-antitoxin system
MIRAALDANILISYLLASDRSTSIRRCVDSGISGAFALLLPEPLLAELTRKVSEKPYPAARIDHDALERLFAVLLSVGEVIPSFDDPIPSISRDEKDDYVLAYARVEDADYLVTGDKDLLVLRDLVNRPAIRTPTEFVRELGFDDSGDSRKPSDETV